MTFVVFDTETSGLFNFAKPADAEGQPRLAHACFIRLDERMCPVDTQNFYVKPDGWEIEEQAARVNGLTTDFLSENGEPVDVVLDYYNTLIDAGLSFAAFNAQYDTKVLRGELRRAGRPDRFEETSNICLMRASHGLSIEKANGKKGWPSLADVCRHFSIPHDDQHKAFGDALAAVTILQRLHALQLLPEPTVHYAKNRPE